RAIALREVKRLLLEELGTYLESQPEVINFQMTTDQIATLTAVIVNAEVIEDTGNGKLYCLKAKIAANPQDVIKSIDNLRNNREKVKELDELRNKSEGLLRENERLNQEFKIATGGRKQEAAQAYKQNLDDLSATEWSERGFKLGISGNFADAVKAFSKVIELNPLLAKAYNSRGTANMKLGNYQEAIRDFNKTVELNPQYTKAYNNIGTVNIKLGNYQEAIKNFDKVTELAPNNAYTYYNRGVAYHKSGNYRQAIADINTAARLGHEKAQNYLRSQDIEW
ncbi:MAG: tetratricopeptide repeat protein, partial [Syntrophales bacterium]|nr:tetratricopeptide repeat protein [Syntrophales bacterium]